MAGAVVPGQVCCWLGDSWGHRAGIAERGGGEGRWRGKQGVALGPNPTLLPLARFLLLTSIKGGLGPYGARHIQHLLHSQSCPSPSCACCNIWVSPPSGHSHTVADVHQQSWEPPLQPGVVMGTPFHPRGWETSPSSQAGRERGKRGKKSVFGLTYNH